MKVHKKNPYGINDEVLLDFACVETSFMVFHYCKHILFIIFSNFMMGNLWIFSVLSLDLSIFRWFDHNDLSLTQFWPLMWQIWITWFGADSRIKIEYYTVAQVVCLDFEIVITRLRIETFKTIKNKFRLFTQVLCFSFDRFTRFYPGRPPDSPSCLDSVEIGFQIVAGRISISTNQMLLFNTFECKLSKVPMADSVGPTAHIAIYFDSDIFGMIYIFRLWYFKWIHCFHCCEITKNI